MCPGNHHRTTPRIASSTAQLYTGKYPPNAALLQNLGFAAVIVTDNTGRIFTILVCLDIYERCNPLEDNELNFAIKPPDAAIIRGDADAIKVNRSHSLHAHPARAPLKKKAGPR
jgi:hypothetical protein